MHKVKTIQKWLSIAKECEEEVYEMWRECVEEEKRWADYLFAKTDQLIGLKYKSTTCIC